MSAAEVTKDTKLSDLTDAQRAELGQRAKEESFSGQALLGPQETLDGLEEEYRKGNYAEFADKVKWLREKGDFIGMRRVRGDGNCFYAAFAFAVVQKLLHFNDRPMHHFMVKHLEGTLALLKKTGFDESIYLEFWEPFKKLLNRMHSTDPEVVELNDQRLQQAFNDAYIVNSIVAYLRLVTSAYLKDNAEDFTPFLFTLEDEFGGKAPTLDDFCANQVEAIGKEADHVQIAALSSCLKVSLHVAYLTASGAPPETPALEKKMGEAFAGGVAVPGEAAAIKREAANDPHRVDLVEFEVPSTIGVGMDIGTLLFRPGHYDLLVRAAPQASPDISIPRA
ncbi:cysteine proteinase [Ceraceosorus guamensis]|uniref:ubiquitinyl hydrolase 1 n=1 Tax=Ceraceosorus guamensis TaxID=1522189 RepID=A0A316VZS5_9BASI|nr:cysteine proteinase [Ceraceosorus guamensis]PWN43096.1 cysteine proteinase [Ceraceosorus guamensis]